MAATQDSTSAEYLLLQGRAELLAANPAAAERALQTATAALPVDPDAFRYLAAAAERLGHRDVAAAARARYAALTE
jgi:predicted Zn-dependent protease